MLRKSLAALVILAALFSIAYAQIDVGTYSLKAGFNFVSFGLKPSLTPADMKVQNPAITEIYGYSAASGSFLTAGEGTLTSLNIGRGYIISANAPVSLTVAGSGVPVIGNISLKAGFNLAGFSKVSELIKFSDLIKRSAAIKAMYKWSAASGSFIQVANSGAGEPNLVDGIDVTIKAGEAYFINVANDTTMNLDGASIQIGDGTIIAPVKTLTGITLSKTVEILPVSGTFDLNQIKVNANYTTDQTLGVTDKAVWALAPDQKGTLDGKTYTASADAGAVLFTVTYTEAGVSKTVQFTLNVQSQATKTLEMITLSKTSDVVLASANYDLASIIITAKYNDNSVSAVSLDAVWALAVGQAGTLAGKVYTAPAAAGKAEFTVSYNENGQQKTAPFTLTINLNDQPPVVNGPLMDVTVPSFAKKALIALNVSGVAEGGENEAVGTLPANVAALSPVSFAFSAPSRSMIKDLPYRSGTSRGPGAPNFAGTKLTETVTNYNFKVNDNNTTKEYPSTLKYGTATSKCLIYLDDTAVTTVDWNKVGVEFDTKIHQKMVDSFGAPTDVDDNGKVVIFYYNMASETTMGYFHSVDLAPGQGNDMEVFYMNIGWGGANKADPLDPEMIRTISHEFQHLINHGQRVIINKRAAMDSWMDEGLAESAEQLVSGVPGGDRLNTFKNDAANKLKNGTRTLCVWPVEGDDEAYGLSYTFFQYIKNQSKDRETMFKHIYTNDKGDYTAVEEVMKTQGEGKFPTFADLLRGYRMANLINGDGIYGYGADRLLKAADGKAYFDFSASSAVQAPLSVDGVKLAPGGAVYVYPSQADLQAFAPNGQGANIRFVRINK